MKRLLKKWDTGLRIAGAILAYLAFLGVIFAVAAIFEKPRPREDEGPMTLEEWKEAFSELQVDMDEDYPLLPTTERLVYEDGLTPEQEYDKVIREGPPKK